MLKRNGYLFITFIIICSYHNITAQETKNLYVEYETSFNLGVTVQRDAILISNGKSSIFKTLNYDSKKLSKSKDGSFNILAKDVVEMIYNDLSISSIVIITTLDNKKYNIPDNFQPLKWELQPGKFKFINGVKVFKAITNFRGRSYIAWFNPAIPVPAGPWKFSGLPGLIIEISDTTNQFQWVVKTIKYPYDLEENVSIPSLEDFSEISYRKFIELKTQFREDMQRQKMARTPQGTRLVSSKITRGIELEYEWE